MPPRRAAAAAAASPRGSSGGTHVDSAPIFLTVGTTRFDALVQAADDVEFAAAAEARGYTSLTIQLGRGEYLPGRLVPAGATEARISAGFVVRYFRFAPALDEYVRAAALVISHAGAGSIFEALRASRPLLVVVNTALMDNHQQELAEALAQRGHLAYCAPEQLAAAFAALQPAALVRYAPGDAAPIARAIDVLCGV